MKTQIPSVFLRNANSQALAYFQDLPKSLGLLHDYRERLKRAKRGEDY